MDLGSLAGQVGFPIAVAVFLLYNDYKTKERIIRSLDASTKALERSNELEEKVLEAISGFGEGKQ